jgi:hypothetical protein
MDKLEQLYELVKQDIIENAEWLYEHRQQVAELVEQVVTVMAAVLTPAHVGQLRKVATLVGVAATNADAIAIVADRLGDAARTVLDISGDVGTVRPPASSVEAEAADHA